MYFCSIIITLKSTAMQTVDIWTNVGEVIDNRDMMLIIFMVSDEY